MNGIKISAGILRKAHYGEFRWALGMAMVIIIMMRWDQFRA